MLKAVFEVSPPPFSVTCFFSLFGMCTMAQIQELGHPRTFKTTEVAFIQVVSSTLLPNFSSTRIPLTSRVRMLLIGARSINQNRVNFLKYKPNRKVSVF